MPEKEKTAVPRLRFPEFRDAEPWEVKRLGAVSEILDNMRKPVTSTNRKPGPYPYYGASGAIDYIDEYIFDERLLLIGEDGAKWGPFEKTAFIVEGKYWVNNHAHVLRPAKIKDVLLENYLNGTDVSVYVTGAAPPKLTLDNLKSIRVPVPPAQEEQQKIADCLSSLDDVIRSEVARLEVLQDQKKGLMQQLFPREGETTPRLRFPEFRDAGPWEVKRLGELFSERNERNGAGLELLSVTMSEGVVRASDLERRNNASSDRSNYKKVYPNDIVYNSMRMWQGASGVSYWKGIVSPAYTVVTPAENQNPVFWAYYFKLPHVIEKFACFSQGVTSDTWNLKYPAFSAIRLSFPLDPFEQQKIANCLASLDDLIRAQGERIETLKQHKKGLMQQLFPQEVG